MNRRKFVAWMLGLEVAALACFGLVWLVLTAPARRAPDSINKEQAAAILTSVGFDPGLIDMLTEVRAEGWQIEPLGPERGYLVLAGELALLRGLGGELSTAAPCYPNGRPNDPGDWGLIVATFGPPDGFELRHPLESVREVSFTYLLRDDRWPTINAAVLVQRADRSLLYLSTDGDVSGLLASMAPEHPLPMYSLGIGSDRASFRRVGWRQKK